LSIHDQGAGGNGNVLKEIVEPEGAVIYTKNFTLGDPTISTLELWGAEYQESDAILTRPEDRDFLNKISRREKCAVDYVGVVTGGGSIRLSEEEDRQLKPDSFDVKRKQNPEKKLPVDLELEHVLGSMPAKKFHFEKKTPLLLPLTLPTGVTTLHALKRVLRLPSVASKRFLTNKVDRSVTGKEKK
jgi:phosphoribosylformylglycinamidine synthase